MPHAVIIDDHPTTLDALAELVRSEGFTTTEANSLETGRAALSGCAPDVVLIDLNLPDGSGMSLVDDVRRDGAPAIVLITGQSSVSSAVEALRRGVTDYLTKPLDFERLRSILDDVQRTRSLSEEIRALRDPGKARFGPLVGGSAVMQTVYDLIARVAPSSATVFVVGESGTGKEVVAQLVHDLSRRRHGPFVAINCGAISPNLMESELFGHERGSFTGADRRHRGCFERAHRGTLFLDEVTEMPVDLQVKLLRVLEKGSFSRIGGEAPLMVDVRIVAATNRRPDEAVKLGKLREDLYYRLKVFQIVLPPLRERLEDIVPLTDCFLEQLRDEEGPAKRLSPAALDVLRRYHWPGNIRELRNVLHTAYILGQDEIAPAALPPEVSLGPDAPAPEKVEQSTGPVVTIPIGTPLEAAERAIIVSTLEHHGGNKTKTADVLGISLKTLYNRLNAYHQAGLLDPRFVPNAASLAAGSAEGKRSAAR